MNAPMQTAGLSSPSNDLVMARAYCRRTLLDVSRTFALNIRILPVPLRDLVLQAYLFCRVADTLEDSPYLSVPEKRRGLEEYGNLFPIRDGWSTRVLRWRRYSTGLEHVDAEHRLAANVDHVFRAFESHPVCCRAPVEACVREMALGMRAFVGGHGRHGASLLQLDSMDVLREYCHYVAGTVGIMLCRVFRVFCPRLQGERFEQMLSLAEPFGLALQVTNIIKDLAVDNRRGVNYLPLELLHSHGLEARQLLDSRHRTQAHQVVADLVQQTLPALEAALSFILLLPRREVRLRLFCLWPLFMALRTLRRVVGEDALFDPGSGLRISRPEVRRCLAETSLVVFSNGAVKRLYEKHLCRLASRLKTIR